MGVKEFFQTIQWRATLQVAGIRIAVAAIMWPLLFLVLGGTKAAEFVPQVFGFLLLLAVFIAVAIPAIGLARANVPFIGLAALPAWMVVVADPLVKLLHMKTPGLVPVEEFNWINPPVLAVFRNDESNENERDRISVQDDAVLSGVTSPGLSGGAVLDSAAADQPDHYGADPRRDEAQAIYEEGLRICEEGDTRQGLLRVLEAIDKDRHHVDANLLVASALYHMDPIENADNISLTVDNVLAVDPENSRAKNILAGTHSAIGKQAWDAEAWTDATGSFIAAYKLDPTMAHLSDLLATSADKAGAFHEAIAAFEQRLADQPDDVAARQLAGRSYIKLATSKVAPSSDGISPGEAISRGERHLKTIISSDPTNVDANYWLAAAYAVTNRDDDVRNIVELLRPIAPEQAAEVEQLLN
jgi:cytochrome c-type biogenesis protein CcmH/NrfG